MLISLAICAWYEKREEISTYREVVEICLRCGVCCNVSHSCHVMYDRRYNPRSTYVYDCLAFEKPVNNPNIWLCVSCHKCEEVCPYDVSPMHFIEYLKGEAFKIGLINPLIKEELAQVITTGYAFPLTGSSERQRENLGLKPIMSSSINELSIIAERTGLTKKLRGNSR